MDFFYPNNKNKIWDFNTWFYAGQDRIEISKTQILDWMESDFFYSPTFTREKLKEISSYFDGFVCSPCNKYYNPENNKTYLFESKSKRYSSLEELQKILYRYRQEYDCLILHTINEHVIRFAAFNFNNLKIICQ